MNTYLKNKHISRAFLILGLLLLGTKVSGMVKIYEYNKDGNPYKQKDEQVFTGPEIENYIYGKGFFVAWRTTDADGSREYCYFNHTRTAELMQQINANLLSLRKDLGQTFDGSSGELCTLSNPQLKDKYEKDVADLSRAEWAKVRLAKFKDAFRDLRRLAILSYGTPNDQENDTFYTTAAEMMGHAMDANFLASYYPMKEKLQIAQAEATQERQQKEALRIEKDQVVAQKDEQKRKLEADKNEIIALRNRDASTWSDTVDTWKQLHADAVTREQNLRNDLAVQNVEHDRENEGFAALLNQADATLEVERNRRIRMDELLQKANQELAQRRAQSPERRRQLEQKDQENVVLKAQLEALRKQMVEQSTQSAEDYIRVRRQLSPLREERNKLQADLKKAQLAIKHAEKCPILRAANQD